MDHSTIGTLPLLQYSVQGVLKLRVHKADYVHLCCVIMHVLATLEYYCTRDYVGPCCVASRTRAIYFRTFLNISHVDIK